MAGIINNAAGLPDGWKEYIGNHVEGPVGGTFEWGTATRVTVTYDGPFAELTAFLKFLLGYSRRLVGGALSRSLPHRLPWMPHLVCTSVSSIRPYRYSQKTVAPALGSYADYTHVRVMAVYTCPPYAVLSDADLDRLYPLANGGRDESRRFVVDRYEPTVEGIQRPTGSFEYAETAAGGPAVGDVVNQGTSQLLSKDQVTLSWMGLPNYGALNSGGRPAAARAYLGCVNNADWRGFTAGTLLFKAYRMDPVPAPFLPDPDNAILSDVPRQWNLHLIFSEFDPPAGSTTHGHNTTPYPGDNKWYKIRSRDAGHTTLYPTADFNGIFLLN